MLDRNTRRPIHLVCALLALTGCAAHAAGETASATSRSSQYSSSNADKACRTVEADRQGVGWYKGRCLGRGGYRLYVTSADTRDDLTILPPGGGAYGLHLAGMINVYFGSIGDTLEWRGRGAGRSFHPDALILRYTGQNPDKPQTNIAALVVVSLKGAKPCIAGVVPPGPDQNAAARRIADGPMHCIQE